MITSYKGFAFRLLMLILFGLSVVACEKQDITPAPSVDVKLTVRGVEKVNTSDSTTLVVDSVGIAVYYDFQIKASANIQDVKTIITKVIDAKTSKVDETITSSFSDKPDALVKGICFIEPTPKELKLVVTDKNGNRTEKAFKVKPIL